ncbi:hypothetical protein SASPL_121825 [Salvia splendens]|uniref:F-box domain-containing protein n=1 Tax=Salvia splendens TaxID=180675 RepID=A0A8X8XT69_SALSN|nr:hypothetical protein SASPL_121825 [Salvia splendens]
MEGRKYKYQTQAVVAAPSSPPWIHLPRDITADILQRLGVDDLQGSRLVAIDRSQGQLIDLTVHYFGSANLMNHIARRSTNLKRVKLGICFHISGFHAARIFAKLPHLEELHLTLDRAVDIRSIGYACPTLKSFSLNTFNCKFVLLEGADDVISFYRNLCARAIAESMPNLQHLQLFAHWIGNQGLEDILEAFSDVPWPNWDGRDPFGPDAYFDVYKYDYYQDGEDYFSGEEDEDDEDVLSEEDDDDEEVLSEEDGDLSEEDNDDEGAFDGDLSEEDDDDEDENAG